MAIACQHHLEFDCNQLMSSSTNGSSASLVGGLQIGHDVAWQQLVDLYAPLVRSWCLASGVRAAEAPDVVQDVFLAVHRKVREFVPRRDTGGFRGWLWTIARNRIHDYFRRLRDREQATGGSTALQWLHTQATDVPEEPPESPGELTAVMHRALEYVRSEFQAQTWEAFWSTTALGRSTADVADQLGVTPAAIRQSRSRVLRRLRQQLGDTL